MLIENYLQFLNTDKRADAKEWRGPNIPYGDDSNRPNLIRQCMTLESDKMKINCLRKLRDQVAMNPFYQARLDRFVDAITGIYEPTSEPGTIPGNEFKPSVVAENIQELRGDTVGAAKTGAIALAPLVAIISSLYAANKLWDMSEINKKAKQTCSKYRGNKEQYNKCLIKIKNMIKAARKRKRQS